MRPVLSGPEIGLGGVAYGPAGYLAYGRATDAGRQRTAVWRSDDGSTWERLTSPDAFPSGARIRTIIGAADGYLLGGVIYRERSPRAAIWSSVDGRAWELARGGDTFGIGGYIDTMEDPGSGGIEAFAILSGAGRVDALHDGVVAVGQACIPAMDEGIWAWNGLCWGEIWRSEDGRTWARDESGPRPLGAMRHVTTLDDAIIVDAPICRVGCASGLLLGPVDAGPWRVAYGSPVDGDLRVLLTTDRGPEAILSIQTPTSGDRLALWSSADGTRWTLEASQPELPLEGIAVRSVVAALAEGRLVVIASGETDAAEDLVAAVLVRASDATDEPGPAGG
jgi:hypothetical protein